MNILLVITLLIALLALADSLDRKRNSKNGPDKIIAAPVYGLQRLPKRRKFNIRKEEGPVNDERITKRHVVRFRILDRPELFIGNGALIAPQRVLTTSSILDPFRVQLRGQLLASGIFDGVSVQNIIINENYKKNPYADIGVASLESEFDKKNDLYPCLLRYTDIQGLVKEVTIGKWNFKIEMHPMSEEQEKNFIFDVAEGHYKNFSSLWKQETITRIMHISFKGNKYALFGDVYKINLGYNGAPVFREKDLVGIISNSFKGVIKLVDQKEFIENALHQLDEYLAIVPVTSTS